MIWLNIFIPNMRAPEFINSEPAARSAWLSILAFCCEQENGGVIIGAESWTDRAWLQTCGVTAEEVRNASPLVSFESGDVTVWNYPEEKEKQVQSKREAGQRGGLAKTQAKTQAAKANGAKGGRPNREEKAETQAENPSTTEAEPKHKPNGIGKEVEGKEKGMEVAATEDAKIPTLETFCEYFTTRIACLGFPVTLDNWLMETHGYYASAVWPKNPPLNWKAMEGKLIANYRNRHREQQSKTMPMRNGKPQKPINDF
jgi:hypothetical protein